MARVPGTTRSGFSFDPVTIQAVWNKGALLPGYDPNVWRRDACGAIMKRWDYGDTRSEYGWEIDHIFPVSAGGLDDLSNLQPLHWQNNRSKGDSVGNWNCAVR